MSQRELTLICDACTRPVDDGAGYLWIDFSEINQRREDVRAWEARSAHHVAGAKLYTSSDVRRLPARVRWNAHHALCDSAPEAAAYTIYAHDMRTWADLARWTGHLMDLRWLADTDWPDVLTGASVSDGTRLTAAAPPPGDTGQPTA